MHDEVSEALQRVANGERASEVESYTLDFKEEANSVSSTEKLLRDAAVCFANSDGGTIILGVDDDSSGRAAFVGTNLGAQTAQRRIYELTQPSILVTCDEHTFETARLLIISVPRSFEIHADQQGRAKRRVGTDCLPMSPQDQAILREERQGVDWSAQVSERTLDQVSADALKAARRRLRQGGGPTSQLADLSDLDLLRSLGVVDDQDRLLRSGAALFCDREDNEPWVVYQHRATPGGEATVVERLVGPLLLVLDRVIELAWARRHVTPLNLPDGTQIELADFPEGAIREAVSNALLHREFRIDAPVTVEHSPSVLVVESPGPLVAGITEQNILTHPSKPRNRNLFQAARKLRIAEETGRGIDRMFRELLSSGHDSPSISQTSDTTRVAFVGGAPRTQVVRFVEQLPEPEREDVDTLLVLFTMLSERTVTASELAPIIQKSYPEADAVLQRLAEDGRAILEPTRETARLRRSRYRLRSAALGALGGAVAYHRRRVDDIDRKVIAHVNEYGRISNRTLQNLFDIDVYKARDVLRDLRDREILVKTSKQERGTAVEYGAGPKFPTSGRRRKPSEDHDPTNESLFE